MSRSRQRACRAHLTFLSCFPGEREYLFPPLTYMQPMGEPQELEIDDATFTIVDVKPNMA